MFITLVRVHVLKICSLLSGRWSLISDPWYLIRGRRIMGDKITDITDLGSGIMDQRSGNILNTLTKAVNIHYAAVSSRKGVIAEICLWSILFKTRNISLNTHYIVLFKSPRDKQQVLILARKVNPGHKFYYDSSLIMTILQFCCFKCI